MPTHRTFRWQTILPILITAVFFAGMLVLGISIYRDYGTYVDEFAQIDIGRLNYEFLKTGDPQKLDFRDWEHGAVFEVLTVLTTRFLPDNWHLWDQIYLRHLDVYLVFWASGLAFFWLIKKKFHSWGLGLLGSLFLFLSPVIFGNAFFNSKDIPLLSFYIFGLLSLTYFLERPNLFTAAVHALVCALLINIRIPGVVLPALTIALLALELLAPNRRQFHPRPGRTALVLVAFGLLCAGLVIVFFPAAWSNPIQRFMDAYLAMTHRSWTCCYNLFMGQPVVTGAIPWFYVPVWIGVSTPLLYVVLFILGLAAGLQSLWVKPRLNLTPEKRSTLMLFGAFFLPLAAVIAGQSVIYNGWRHMYFIYAPFLVIAIDGLVFLQRGLTSLIRPRLASALVGLLILVSVVTTAEAMIQSHPYEFIYFNPLAGRDMAEIKGRFELDYWGLSYVDGMRFLLKNDPSPIIKVATNQTQINQFSYLLTDAERGRLSFPASPLEADYYMTDYYQHPEAYEYPSEVYSIKVGNARILSIFQLNPEICPCRQK